MRPAPVIAAAQSVPRRGDVDASLEEHVRLVDAAAREQVRVLVFPELSLTGYELDLAEQLAFTESDSRLESLSAQASSHGMTLIVGAPVRLGRLLHIGAFILAPDEPPELYTKHHLGAVPAEANLGGPVPPAEATVFQPGNRNPLVRIDGHSAAVAVCADTGQARHAAAAARRGARSYLAGVFFTASGLAGELEQLRVRAERHSMLVAMANYGGPSGGLASGGSSAIISPEGELLAQLEERCSGLAIAMEDESGWQARTVVIERRGSTRRS